MGLNIEEIKNAVKCGIQVNPTNISLMRDNKLYDDFGGYTIDPYSPTTEVINLDIFINEATSSLNDWKYSEGGRRANVAGVSALMPYEYTFTVEKGDYFIVGNKTYIVDYPLNMYNAYWTVGLEVKFSE